MQVMRVWVLGRWQRAQGDSLGKPGPGLGKSWGWSCCRVFRSNKGTGAAGAEESGRTVGPPRSSRTGDAANEAQVLREREASEGEGAAGAGLTEAFAGSCCHAVSQGQGCERRRLSGKESACSAGGPGSTPGSGGSPGEGHGYPLQYPWPGEFHGPRSLVGHTPRDRKESDTTQQARRQRL